MNIYKYLSPERIDVLLNKKIRFTQAKALNDPFELSPFFEELISKSRLLDELTKASVDLTPHLRKSYEELPAEFRAIFTFENMLALMVANTDAISSVMGEGLRAVFGELDKQMPKMKEIFYERMRSEIGILSLTETPDNMLMWTHYASEHKGFLLEFNKAHPFFDQRRNPEDEFYHLRQVNYLDRKVFRDIMELSGEDILLAKTSEWAYEREWRMLLPLPLHGRPFKSADGDEIYLVPFEPEAVAGIVLGAKMPLTTQHEVLELLSADKRYQHVKVYEAVLNQRTGGVDIN